MAVDFLVDIVQRMLAAFCHDIGSVGFRTQSLLQTLLAWLTDYHNPSPAFSRLQHAGYDCLYFLVGGMAVGCLRWGLGGEDDQSPCLPGLFYLPEVADGDDSDTRQDDGMEVLRVHAVAHRQSAVTAHAAAVVKHLGMEVGEVSSQFVCQQSRHLVVVQSGNVDAAMIVPLGTIEVRAAHHRLNGIEHSDVGHMLPRAAQHILHAGQEGIEVCKTTVVERIAP